MSLPPRLRLLYPAIAPVRTSVRQRPGKRAWIAQYSQSAVHLEEARPTRYGKANAPPPHIVAAIDLAKEEAKSREKGMQQAREEIAKEVEDKKQVEEDKRLAKSQDQSQNVSSAPSATAAERDPARQTSKDEVDDEDDEVLLKSAIGLTAATTAATANVSPKPSSTSIASDTTLPSSKPGQTPAEPVKPDESVKPPMYLDIIPANPLQKVLQLERPDDQSESDRPPHLQAPQYVHHFNTWSLVQDLEKGGFEHQQSIDMMKAVRGLLAEHLDLARRGLISKSNVENETYLFRAACSELKTEVQARRRAEAEKLRAQRAQLQHEVDILNQRVGQETANMKDELKGQFDDRKMALRMEQRNMDGRIQEINYRIQVALNSDARSEVESMRWVLTRRAAGALAITAIMVLSALQYSKYMTQTQERERKKHARELEELTAREKVMMTSSGTQTQTDLPFPPVNGEEALAAGAGVTLG